MGVSATQGGWNCRSLPKLPQFRPSCNVSVPEAWAFLLTATPEQESRTLRDPSAGYLPDVHEFQPENVPGFVCPQKQRGWGTPRGFTDQRSGGGKETADASKWGTLGWG